VYKRVTASENTLDSRDIGGIAGAEPLITSEVLYQLSYVGGMSCKSALCASHLTVWWPWAQL
jgi:hypothetical protein